MRRCLIFRMDVGILWVVESDVDTAVCVNVHMDSYKVVAALDAVVGADSDTEVDKDMGAEVVVEVNIGVERERKTERTTIMQRTKPMRGNKNPDRRVEALVDEWANEGVD